METLPLAFQTRVGGWTVNKPQTISRAVLRLIDSRGVKAGPTDTKLESLRSRRNEILGQANQLMNGLYEASLQPDINGGARIVVQSDDPLPLTVTAIYIDPMDSE
jgi:hypothetical protein